MIKQLQAALNKLGENLVVDGIVGPKTRAALRRHPLFQEWDKTPFDDERWIAYIFATAWHETAHTLKPISEFGSGDGPDPDKWDDYFTRMYDRRTDLGNTPEIDGDGELFKGRGYVQITGRNNYRKYGIEGAPWRALEPDFAAHIMIDGMTKGTFTGRKLSQYFSTSLEDPINARRIVNGIDRAEKIADYYLEFLKMV